MSQPSAKSFLKLLEMSGIVAQESLKPVIESLNKQQQAAGKSLTAEALADHLIASGLITSWHSSKLLTGKYKGFFLGKFKLLGHLGTGGMSSVYLAQHRISEQLRAIKVLPRKRVDDKSYLDRFYLEARAAASLNHPHVVRIYDICREGKTHYMVMEYVKGKNLAEWVVEDGPLSCERAARFLIDAAEGLSHAHQRKLVHRDIKPANLLVTDETEIVKILDLGLALVNQDDSQSLTMLYNEKVMGTADYLSPEQAVNSHDVDHRADIYSLGCTLYFLLAGHPPFPDGTLAQRIAKHQSESPVSLRTIREDCPDALARISEKMMAKQPDDRFQSCLEVKSALENFLASGQFDDPSPRPSAIPTARPVAAKPVPAGTPANPLAIDTGESSVRVSARPTLEPNRLTTRRKPQRVPRWIAPALIGLMFLILVSVLIALAVTLN